MQIRGKIGAMFFKQRKIMRFPGTKEQSLMFCYQQSIGLSGYAFFYPNNNNSSCK
jgi:hypothetical protein